MKVINFEHRPCEKTRRYLDSYLSNELLIETNHEVLHHLETCKECSKALEARARVRGALQRAVRRGSAPAELESGIRESVRARHPWARFPTFRWASATAALFILALGGYGILELWRGPDLKKLQQRLSVTLGIGVRDHVECAINHQMYTRRYTFNDMVNALGSDFTGLISIVQKNIPSEFDLVVAHKCRINEREFAHFILRDGERVVSLAITPKGSDSFTQSEVVAALKSTGIDLYQDRVGNFEVAGFESPRYLTFVISNLRQDENLQIASNLAPKVNEFLSRK